MKLKKYILRRSKRYIQKCNWYNTVFLDCKKFWDGFPMGLDIVNLGSTSSYFAFNYEDIEKKCANWAMRPQTMFADFLILQNYCSCLKPGSIVLIPLCPFSSLSSPRYLSKGADRYYTILACESIQPYSIEKHNQMILMKNQPQRFFPARDMILEIMRDCHLLKRNNHTHVNVPEELIRADAQNRVDSWKNEFNIIDFSHPLRLHNQDMLELAKAQLREMINFCKEREYVPVVVVPPLSSPLAAMFPDYAVEKYVTPLLEVGQNEGALVLDYLKDKTFGKCEYYQDSICMNKIGAKVFTQRVLKDIEDYGNK